MTYTLTSGTAIMRDSDGAIIPADPMNEDYQTYLAWIAAGNSPTAAPSQPPPLTYYTFTQFMTLFTSAEQAAIMASNDTQTKIYLMAVSGLASFTLSDSEVIAAVNYIATGPALITSTRATAILAGMPPQ